MLLSFITLIVVVVVSLATEEPTPEQVRLLSGPISVGLLTFHSDLIKQICFKCFKLPPSSNTRCQWCIKMDAMQTSIILLQCLQHLCVTFHVFFSSFEQISRLTWFTRFDPVKPKVEQRSTNLEVITTQRNETTVAGRERESSKGQACHHRSGGTLPMHLMTLSSLAICQGYWWTQIWTIKKCFLFLLELSRLCVVCIQCSQSVQIYDRLLLAVWDGEKEGGRWRSCDSSCTWAGYL